MLDQKGLQLRAAFFRAIRLFFEEQGFLEVDTPIRQPLLIPEQNIVPISTSIWSNISSAKASTAETGQYLAKASCTVSRCQAKSRRTGKAQGDSSLARKAKRFSQSCIRSP